MPTIFTEGAIKTIFVLCGLPYSGKTTIVNELQEKFGALVIERDRFLEDVRSRPETAAKIKVMAASIANPVSTMLPTVELNRQNDALTMIYVDEVQKRIQAAEEKVVIVDGTHLQPLSRSFIYGLEGITKIAIILPNNPDLSIERLAKGKEISGIRATVTPELIRAMSKVYELPMAGEGFDEILSPDLAKKWVI